VGSKFGFRRWPAGLFAASNDGGWPKGEWQLWNKPAHEAAVRTAAASARSRPKAAAGVTTATICLSKDKVIDFVFAFADFAIAASWSVGSAFPLRALAALPALQGCLLATTA
jgi:hypothetical protein